MIKDKRVWKHLLKNYKQLSVRRAYTGQDVFIQQSSG
jgi:hypothetical protein